MIRCNNKHLTRHRFHGSRRETGESACQGRANNVAAVRRPSLLSNGTMTQVLTVARVVCFILACATPAQSQNIPYQVHKTQALSIKHLVLGCLEGVFALGQVYVLVSRVTDPKNFTLVGIPPRDLVEDLAQALLRAGIDVDSFFEKACQVSGA